MSKLCQGPRCHMYDTSDRKRGPKGNKRNQTRTVGHNGYDNRTYVYLNKITNEQRPLTKEQFNDSTYTLNTGE